MKEKALRLTAEDAVEREVIQQACSREKLEEFAQLRLEKEFHYNRNWSKELLLGLSEAEVLDKTLDEITK